VNGNDLLAFEATTDWDIKFMKGGSMLAGGLFNVVISGPGVVAFTTIGEPITLLVAPGKGLATDPQATVCWSANLAPRFRTDITLKSFFRPTGEEFQMVFDGDKEGFVIIQPYEERPIPQARH